MPYSNVNLQSIIAKVGSKNQRGSIPLIDPLSRRGEAGAASAGELGVVGVLFPSSRAWFILSEGELTPEDDERARRMYAMGLIFGDSGELGVGGIGSGFGKSKGSSSCNGLGGGRSTFASSNYEEGTESCIQCGVIHGRK
jgi:hypothetical protein